MDPQANQQTEISIDSLNYVFIEILYVHGVATN